jgi:hypothetical protein
MALMGSPPQILAICSTARSKSCQLRWRIGGKDGSPSWASMLTKAMSEGCLDSKVAAVGLLLELLARLDGHPRP